MTCEEIAGLLADYLGDELEEAERARVDAHLGECQTCREEVRSLQESLEALAGSPDIETAEAVRRTAGLEVRRREGRGRRIALAILRAAAVLLLGLALGWRLGATRSPQTSTGDDAVRAAERGIHPGWIAAAGQVFSRSGRGLTPPPW